MLPPFTDVAVSIVRSSDGRLLMAERTARQLSAGFWELPGGKVRYHYALGHPQASYLVSLVIGEFAKTHVDVDGVPHIYVPLNQFVERSLSLALRTSSPASTTCPPP